LAAAGKIQSIASSGIAAARFLETEPRPPWTAISLPFPVESHESLKAGRQGIDRDEKPIGEDESL